jgi:hypothetical protein
MANTELKTDTATLALRAAAILGVLYGTGFFLMPSSMLQLSGDPGVPTNSGWVRWAGGFVLGIAIGPWLASEGWVKEQPFIAGLAAAFTLSGLALLYSVVTGEYAGAAWVHLDANCHPGRARPDTVVSRNQVTDAAVGHWQNLPLHTNPPPPC